MQILSYTTSTTNPICKTAPQLSAQPLLPSLSLLSVQLLQSAQPFAICTLAARLHNYCCLHNHGNCTPAAIAHRLISQSGCYLHAAFCPSTIVICTTAAIILITAFCTVPPICTNTAICTKFLPAICRCLRYSYFCATIVICKTTVPRSAVGYVSGNRCESDCRSRGREFDPGPVPYFRGD